MLEGLDAIPWAELEHAYGPAADVPELIRALASSDDKTRGRGYAHLYGNIFHQGSRYQATPYVVPFLFELLLDSSTPDRQGLLSLLLSLAMGYEQHFLPFGFDPDAYFALLDTQEAHEKYERALALGVMYGEDDTAEEKEDDPDGGYDDEERLDLFEIKSAFGARDAYRAVRDRLQELLPLLEEDDLSVRLQTAYAFAWFPERFDLTFPRLLRIAVEGRTPFERANALPALGILARSQNVPMDTPLLLECLKEPYPTVQRLAAVALITLFGAEAPEEAFAVLLVALLAEEHEAETDRTEPHVLWNHGDLVGYAAIVLEKAAQGRAEVVVAALLAALEGASPLRSLTLIGVLLRLTFPERKFHGDRAESLNPLQRRTLKAIAEHGAWKVGRSHFSQFGTLLHSYNLPSTQETMRNFLA